MPEDPRETLIECPACGGDTRQECDLCAGTGCTSAARAAGWLFEHARKRFTSRELAAIGLVRMPKPKP